MTITIVRCEVCGEPSHCYELTVPKKNPKQCPKCHRNLEPITNTYHFCSMKHLKEYLQINSLEELQK